MGRPVSAPHRVIRYLRFSGQPVIPGIYLQTDQEVMFVFDQVEARIIKRTADSVWLSITNPTKMHAELSIFAEKSENSVNPLGYTAFLNWPKVKIEAGATRKFVVNPGKIVQL